MSRDMAGAVTCGLAASVAHTSPPYLNQYELRPSR
jgi:hypothetical protein